VDEFQGTVTSSRPRVLFVSYNSLIEPLGPTQIVPYVDVLARDYRMTVLSFEKPVRSAEDDERARRELEGRLREHGVSWIQLPYHKKPSLPATLYDITAGFRRIVREHRATPFSLVHARGYVPAAIAWRFKRRTGVPFLFDIRGLQAEEYADAGHWHPKGLPFRLTKYAERKILKEADGLVTLTDAIGPVLRGFSGLRERPAVPPWRVIPTCVDLRHFRFSGEQRRDLRSSLGFDDRPILVYAGSVGTWYLLDEMLDFYQVAKRVWPRLVLMLLVNSDPGGVDTRIRARGIAPEDFVVRSVSHEEMPRYLSAADAGFAFIKACVSKLSSSPTKYGEYLACGLPIAINAGVGDAHTLITRDEAGVLVEKFTDQHYESAALSLCEAVGRGRDHYRRIAERLFGLEERAYPEYRSLYTEILARRPRRRVLFLTPYPPHCAPSQRLKFEQYYRHFEDDGIQVVVSPFVAPALWRVLYQSGFLLRKLRLGLYGYVRRLRDFVRASRYDAVYVHLWSLPFGPPWFEELLHWRGIRLIYDIDDLIYLPRASRANRFLTRLRKEDRIVRILKVADQVIVCTSHLERFAAGHNTQITFISSTIDTDIYRPRHHSTRENDVTIGWSGSHSTAEYVHLLEPVMRELARRFGIRLLVIGDASFCMPGVSVDARSWDLDRETLDLAEMDIGVYPLPNEEWVLGKSGLKALQYMGMAVPVVATRIGAACDFIEDGVNGFLASSHQEWIEKLSRLVREPELRRRIGLAGRQTVEERFSVRVNADTYVRVLNSAIDTARQPAAHPAPERPDIIAKDSKVRR
jgi:L-malate glycosyltransferase